MCSFTFTEFSTISIHALRGEGDGGRPYFCRNAAHFYPRPPWGGRLFRELHGGVSMKFLSTPSVGRATRWPQTSGRMPRYFYPRPPWGGRPAKMLGILWDCYISIHALRGEGDRFSVHSFCVRNDFYPRPPWGGRRQKCLKNSCTFVSNHTIGSLIYREILPEPQRNRQNNLCFTPKIRCDSPG